MKRPVPAVAPIGPESAGPSLVVSEIFGPTFQGEGPSLGRHCAFLRLAACNLRCRWCDTAYTWDWTGITGTKYDPKIEMHRMSVTDVVADLNSRSCKMLVVTGGEPLLQQVGLSPLLKVLRAQAWRIELETAGTISPGENIVQLVDQFNVSIKLSNSGNAPAKRIRPETIDRLRMTRKACWKFVVQTVGDLAEVSDLVTRYQLGPVFIMPEGTNLEIITKRASDISEEVLRLGWNLTTRLHVLLYGNRRGV